MMGTDFFLETLCLRAYDNSERTNKLVKSIINMFHTDVLDNAILDTSHNRLYIKILEELVVSDINLSNTSERTALLMKFQSMPAISDDPELLDKLGNLLSDTHLVSDKRIEQLQTKISNTIIWYHSNKHLRKMFAKNQQCAIVGDSTTQDILLNEVLDHARDLVKAYQTNSGSDEAANVEEIDLTDPNSISNAINTYRSQKQTNILKTGWQGLNRMLGEAEGITLGEFVGFAALPHNCKSKMLLNMARWIAVNNKPEDAGGKIPTILHISLEDEAHTNLMEWFKDAYVNAYHKSPEGLTDQEIQEYVAKTFGVNGFKLIVIRKLGVFYGYEEWLQTCEELKASGHKIYACLVDYMALMKIDEKSNAAKSLQQLAGNMKNYAKHEGFALLTGFQLDNYAAQIATSGQTYIAKRFGMTHLSDCKAFFKEVDVLIFTHIEKNQSGVPYLTMAWGKHRGAVRPLADDMYTAYKFDKFGILDDLNGKDRSVKDIYIEEETENTNVSLF